MTKAEEQALKAYPKMSRIIEPEGILIGDGNAEKRVGFVEGYKQAEQDLMNQAKHSQDLATEELPLDESKLIAGKDYVPVDWVETLDMYGKWKIVRVEPISEDLERCVVEQMEADGDVDDFVRRGIDDIASKYAQLGAQWQKEQMMKDAIETTIDGKVVKVIVIDE